MNQAAAMKRLGAAAERMRAGDDAGAEQATRALLAEQPQFARAHALLGRVLNRRNDPAAEASLRTALELEPGFMPASMDMVMLLRRSGRAQEALEIMEQLLAADPGNAAMYADLGQIQLETGAIDAALSSLRRACTLQPALHEAWHALARVCASEGLLDEALQAADRAAATRPDSLAAALTWGRVRLVAGHAENALRAAESILSRHPALDEAIEIKAAALHQLGQWEPASALLHQLLERQPERVELWAQLGAASLASTETDKARIAFARGLALDPDNHALRWAHMQCLPRLPACEQDLDEAAAQWARDLEAFHELLERKPPTPSQALDCLQGPTAFYRHYIPGDLKPGQLRMAEALQRLAATIPVADPQINREPRIRIGFVSAMLHKHTVLRLFGDWMRMLDRERFEVHALHLGVQSDAATETLRDSVDHYHAARALSTWLKDIPAMGFDVLLYLDIGMEPMAQALSSFRLAPLQAMTWGHPVTSGQPSMELFLSNELMESPGSEAQYCEKLVRLPGHGLTCSPPEPGADTRFHGKLVDAPLQLVCAQNPAKLLPEHFRLFARIAAALPDAGFSFVGGRSATLRALLAQRIREAFAAEQQDFDSRVSLHPPLTEPQFLALLGSADLVLDTSHWSGGQTALDTLWMDTPIITLGGNTLRARHTQALLTRMDLHELIVDSEDAYIAKVHELARDPARRSELVEQIRQRKTVLYNDRSVLAALENTLQRAALAARAAHH